VALTDISFPRGWTGRTGLSVFLHETVAPVQDRLEVMTFERNRWRNKERFEERNIDVVIVSQLSLQPSHDCGICVGCLDVTSTHVSSTVTFRPTWNVHGDIFPLWHFDPWTFGPKLVGLYVHLKNEHFDTEFWAKCHSVTFTHHSILANPCLWHTFFVTNPWMSATFALT
jgi:hypothetical protein